MHIIRTLPKALYLYPFLLLTINPDSVSSQSQPFTFNGRASDSGSSAVSDLPTNSSLVWQPLRATFRPLNRRPPPSSTPSPASPPPPPPPEPLALVNTDSTEFTSPPDSTRLSSQPPLLSNFQPIITTSTSTTTASPIVFTPSLEDEDLPTRVPLNRFRPTKPPSVDTQSQPPSLAPPVAANSRSQNASSQDSYQITNECFECICEASTSCNVNSRCQTSDVRHTRCGMFLINYDQWLETGLSKQLVTREALARDAAADERAFYECVTSRDCAERLMSIYMEKNGRDCDKDGRIDCYDVAAIHQGGVDGCSSESLLESQYWSDFNACFGFGR